MNDSSAAATILIVEDDPLFRSLLCHMIEVLGFRVAAKACCGKEAVEMCRAVRPDLVLMDIMMPGLDGIDAAVMIRAEREVPIVFVSGFLADEIYERARKAGACGFLRKPFMLDELRTVLVPHLGRQSVKTPHGLAHRPEAIY